MLRSAKSISGRGLSVGRSSDQLSFALPPTRGAFEVDADEEAAAGGADDAAVDEDAAGAGSDAGALSVCGEGDALLTLVTEDGPDEVAARVDEAGVTFGGLTFLFFFFFALVAATDALATVRAGAGEADEGVTDDEGVFEPAPDREPAGLTVDGGGGRAGVELAGPPTRFSAAAAASLSCLTCFALSPLTCASSVLIAPLLSPPLLSSEDDRGGSSSSELARFPLPRGGLGFLAFGALGREATDEAGVLVEDEDAVCGWTRFGRGPMAVWTNGWDWDELDGWDGTGDGTGAATGARARGTFKGGMI